MTRDNARAPTFGLYQIVRQTPTSFGSLKWVPLLKAALIGILKKGSFMKLAGFLCPKEASVGVWGSAGMLQHHWVCLSTSVTSLGGCLASSIATIKVTSDCRSLGSRVSCRAGHVMKGRPERCLKVLASLLRIGQYREKKSTAIRLAQHGIERVYCSCIAHTCLAKDDGRSRASRLQGALARLHLHLENWLTHFLARLLMFA